METAYARIAMMTMMTLTFKYDHTYLHFFSMQLLPNATLGHQDNISLMSMKGSMERARYLSGIRPIVVLFSSSIRYCTRLNV